MRRYILTTSLGAMVLATMSTIPQTTLGGAATARTPLLPQGYCRNAPALPDIGKEARDEQQQGDGHHTPAATSAERKTMDYEEGVVETPPAPTPLPEPPPLPSPSMVEAAPDSSVAEIIVTESRSEPTSASPAITIPRPPMPDPERSRPPRGSEPQAGLLTAGEHDDLLNPLLYAHYIKRSDLGQKIRDLPTLDTSRLLTIEVTDDGGTPMPFAKVEITCSDGNKLALTTQANGRAIFFPELDRLSPDMTIRVTQVGDGVVKPRPYKLSSQAGSDALSMVVQKGTAQAVRKMDLVLVVDTTGSMGDELRFLQVELDAILDRLKKRHANVDIQLGFVFYRDVGDEYVTRSFPLSTNFQTRQTNLSQQSANGGGDYPEAMDEALIRAAGLEWRNDAVRSVLLVADAPPHNELMGKSWAAAENLRAKGVHITPIAASGVADEAEYIMRAMAAATQSRYVFLTDDSGVGNPHAKPAIDCYLVTRLDNAVQRVLDGQLSGRRVEPDKDQVIRSVGQYDAGRCVLPKGFTPGQEQ